MINETEVATVKAKTVEEHWSVGIQETKNLVQTLKRKYQNQSDVHVRSQYMIEANQEHVIVFRFDNTRGIEIGGKKHD